jgi:hypothetical protein
MSEERLRRVLHATLAHGSSLSVGQLGLAVARKTSETSALGNEQHSHVTRRVCEFSLKRKRKRMLLKSVLKSCGDLLVLRRI